MQDGGNDSLTMRDLNIGTKAGLAVISNKWYALILTNLSAEEQDFMNLRHAVRGISTFNLLIKVRELCDLNLVHDNDYHYTLTLDGQYLQQMLNNLEAWGNRKLSQTMPLHQQHH